MERELEKDLKEIEYLIYVHKNRGNTNTQSVLERVYEIIEPCAKAAKTLPELEELLSCENTLEITRSTRDNDGWITVEERLPEMFGKYWATIRYDDGRISEPIVVDFRGVRQKYVVDTPNGREYETWGIDSAFHGSRVIAWRPYYIPEPYRPERSRENEK